MSWLWKGRATPRRGARKRKKDIEELVGEKVLIRKYEGCRFEFVVRPKMLPVHMGMLRKHREDMKPFRVEDSYYAWFVDVRGEYGVWAAEHKEILIHDDWQLRTEYSWAPFTTVERWDDAKKIPHSVLAEAIEMNSWIFAKTMAYNPHWYALRRQWDASKVDFDDFVLYLRHYGYTQIYRSVKYRCLNVGDHFYWTMGAPAPLTELINRKVLPAPTIM